MKETKIEIELSHAKNILAVLKNSVTMGFKMVSLDVVKDLTDEQHQKLRDIFYKYHNANCGPFNRCLETLIENKEKEILAKANVKVGVSKI